MSGREGQSVSAPATLCPFHCHKTNPKSTRRNDESKYHFLPSIKLTLSSYYQLDSFDPLLCVPFETTTGKILRSDTIDSVVTFTFFSTHKVITFSRIQFSPGSQDQNLRDWGFKVYKRSHLFLKFPQQ
jgi:hypothetical protein